MSGRSRGPLHPVLSVASSFLSKATKWLAIVFFGISLFMAWHATDRSQAGGQAVDLGVMSQVPVAPVAPQGDAVVPAAPSQSVPAADAEVPAAPAADTAPQSPESASSESAGE